MKKHLLTAALTLCMLGAAACSHNGNGPDKGRTQTLILDTDLGNSLDDLLAMAIIHKAQGEGKACLAAVMVNHDIPQAPLCADIMNRFYGFPGTPVGMVQDGVCDSRIWEDYAPLLCGCPAFTAGMAGDISFPDATALYRRTLADAPDNSVTILSVGFLTNLARLLESGPDACSPLDGTQLVRRKVKGITAMCGSENEVEYNIQYDVKSAATVFEKLPVRMDIVPSEVHLEISTADITAASSWADPHPLALAWTTHDPEDQNWCWDAVAAMACLGRAGVTFSAPCEISLDKDGMMKVDRSATEGRFRLISMTESQQGTMKGRVLEALKK